MIARGALPAPAVLDGGLSTALQAHGHDLDHDLWTARLLHDEPEAIVEAHLAYLRAGARIIITSSYQASIDGFVRHGHTRREARELIRRTTELAVEARRRHGDPSVLIAASVGPYGAVLADGSEYSGEYGLLRDELSAFHRERLAVLVGTGPDLLACETIPSAFEAGVLVDALAAWPDASTWMTFTCRDDAMTASGDRIEAAVAVAVSSPQVVAVGVNCTAPQHVEGLLQRIVCVTDRPFVVYPNSGQTWEPARNRWVGAPIDITAGGQVERWRALGATLIGGCCGVGPEAIAALAGTVSSPRR
ncbi:MAG: homocysteine S-methyltransferase [Acidimicrobiia bacterium]